MKSQIILFLIFITSWIGHSQIGPNDEAVYIDSLNNLGNEKNYKFIRVIKEYAEDKDLYDVYFFNRSGKLAQRATTSNKYFMAFEGTYIYYYENGNKQKIETYSDKRVNGRQFEWYENGNPKLESEIVFDNKSNNWTTKIVHYWNSNNEQKVIEGEGEYEETESYRFENKSPNIIYSKGAIKKYVKDGIWEGNSIQKKFNFTEKFKNGKFISGKSIDSLGVENTYNEIETKPKPKRGLDDFYHFIEANYNRPDIGGLIGQIYINFVVEKNGKLTNVKVIKDLGYGTGEEAIRVLLEYGYWLPATQRGIPVRTFYSLPISF